MTDDNAMDSREKLEVDLKTRLYEFGGYCFTSRETHTDNVDTFFDDFVSLLDRQGAITEREHPGLTISDDESLINWRGENYVRQSALGDGKLTAEQVRDALMSADRWKKPMGNTGLTNTHVVIRDDGWQAIADELNATLDSGECELIEVDSYSNANEVIHVLECSACGETCEHVNGSYPKCPHCGRKAVKR